MNHHVEELCQILKLNQPVVMATVLSHQGSTPRGAGSRMLVLPGGEIIGTIALVGLCLFVVTFARRAKPVE